MSTHKRLRNFWIPWVTTIVLACFSNAVAHTSYKVTDLGTLGNDNMSCAMTLNNRGWTAIQDGNAVPGHQDQIGKLLNGRDAIVINGAQVDLGTLGGENSFMNWGEINDWGQIVGYSETDALDPNGEDVCGFGTGHMCLPFLWQDFHMNALPTLGGNNGQARSITADKSQELRKRPSRTPDAHLTLFHRRYYGKKANPSLCLQWITIQTGTLFGSTI
jgi:hypothetical protein